MVQQITIERREYNKRYSKEHRTEIRARLQKWRDENRDKVREKEREYRNRSNGKRKAYGKKWVLENKDKVKQMAKRHRDKLRIIVIGHYSNGLNKCNCCGESIFNFLTIDHINGNGRAHERERIRNGETKDFYTWLIKNNFPDGYRVLCMNCNFAIGKYGKCPHELSVIS